MEENLSSKDGKNHLRPVIIAALAAISLVFSVFFLVSPDAAIDKTSKDHSAIDAAHQARPASAPLQTVRYDFRLSQTDTFYSVMSVFNMSAPEIEAAAKAALTVFDLRRLKHDTVLRIFATGDEIERIEYPFSEYESLIVGKNPSTGSFDAHKEEFKKEVKLQMASGVIESSLYEDGIKAGLDPQAIMNMTDIFAWDVDFSSEIRKGDSFSMLFEELHVNGRPVKTGRILGAEMMNAGKKYTAVYYEDGRGKGGYYDNDGRSMERTLLKTPLRFRRITSYFTRKRFHPILKRYRPHHGIDYAAPAGTPVEAAGSGRVVHAGWKGGYGNFVEVRHSNGYVTGYGHLSRIGKGIRTGVNIEQGSIVGYVGSTGISTGPHLHYEVKMGGSLINPLSIKPTPNKAIAKPEMNRFASVRDDILNTLSNGGHAAPVFAKSIEAGQAVYPAAPIAKR
ncbi:MAG: peptidoglycan DD-metalloendopeptidase family protein [Deltaproteobacteria bacterium]|nr:peptidoglycan DD-metalloendopeptidase family protein [Deltaproteobacteria bacterium]